MEEEIMRVSGISLLKTEHKTKSEADISMDSIHSAMIQSDGEETKEQKSEHDKPKDGNMIISGEEEDISAKDLAPIEQSQV